MSLCQGSSAGLNMSLLGSAKQGSFPTLAVSPLALPGRKMAVLTLLTVLTVVEEPVYTRDGLSGWQALKKKPQHVTARYVTIIQQASRKDTKNLMEMWVASPKLSWSHPCSHRNTKQNAIRPPGSLSWKHQRGHHARPSALLCRGMLWNAGARGTWLVDFTFMWSFTLLEKNNGLWKHVQATKVKRSAVIIFSAQSLQSLPGPAKPIRSIYGPHWDSTGQKAVVVGAGFGNLNQLDSIPLSSHCAFPSSKLCTISVSPAIQRGCTFRTPPGFWQLQWLIKSTKAEVTVTCTIFPVSRGDDLNPWLIFPPLVAARFRGVSPSLFGRSTTTSGPWLIGCVREAPSQCSCLGGFNLRQALAC